MPPENYTCIGILSDTHGRLPESVPGIFSGGYSREDAISRSIVDEGCDPDGLAPARCRLIAHAGDIGNADSTGAQSIIDRLEEVAPVVAVLGNCDYPIYRTTKGDIGEYAVFEAAGVTFAMVHEPKELTLAVRGDGMLRPAYIKPTPMVGIHGHTHIQRIGSYGKMLMVCPGSTTRSKEDQRRSVMVMYLSEGKVLAIDIVAV